MNYAMDISYDALKAMIEQMFQEMKAADKNELIDQYDLAQDNEETTKQYCMKLVAPELRKSFINQMNTLELASKGRLNKESYVPPKIKKGKICIKVVQNTDEKSPNPTALTKPILIKIIDDVIREMDKPSTGDITKRREGLFPSWKSFRQMSRGIVEKKKQKKKGCSQGAPYHDEDGEFTDKANAASWSLKFSTGDDCKRGQARVSGGKELFSKLPAGRKHKDGGKEKYKLKDGTPAYE